MHSDSPLAGGWGLWISWVLAGTVAWAVGGLLGRALGPGHILGYVYVTLTLGGILLGALQWLVLRRQIPRAGWWVLRERVARAGWWVLASTLGWVAGEVLDEIVGVDMSWALFGAVYGAVTGPVLVWLLRHRTPSADQPSAVPI